MFKIKKIEKLYKGLYPKIQIKFPWENTILSILQIQIKVGKVRLDQQREVSFELLNILFLLKKVKNK